MDLEQFKISRAIGLSFKSLFRNIIPFTILAAVIYAPAYYLTLTADQSADIETYINRLITYPIYAIIAGSALLAPMMTYRIVQEMTGVRVSMMKSISYGMRGILPAAMFGGLAFVAQMLPGGGILSAILTCILFVCAPAAVAERLGPIEAFSRSATLTSGRRWGIFGLTFMIGLVQLGIIMLWLAPKLSGSGSFEENLGESIASGALTFMIVISVFQLFTGIVEAVSYALLRQDKDGMSHEILASVFD